MLRIVRPIRPLATVLLIATGLAVAARAEDPLLGCSRNR